LYTAMLATGEYGVVTNLYAYVALTLVILTYGMETGFFRFINHEKCKDPFEVYSTTLISVGTTSLLFIALIFAALTPLCSALDCADHPSYVWMMAVAVATDAFTAIPFSYIRYKKRPIRFAVLRCVNIGLNIALNLFFFLVIFDPAIGVGYIFFANFISSLLTIPLLLPELTGFRWRFNRKLWRNMIAYSLPLLVLGIAGNMNQNLDKILLPFLLPDKAEAMAQLGIYGACCKVALVMMMFTQAFRFAYEPFIFAQNKSRGADKLEAYSDAMKYFVIFAMLIFLGVMFYMNIIRHFIPQTYWGGLKVVPIIMIADVCFGVFFNLSLWYKLTDKTIWGTWFSLLGLAVTVGLNVLLIPRIGYMGCAWTSLACYGTMMTVSYFVGRSKHPLRYPVRRIGCYVLLALMLYALGELVSTGSSWLDMVARTPLLLIYIGAVLKFERIPLIHR
ncbi:MAG: oligosaccharide flippase family protein, partial [Muribaculaceae bacterium]|nr:oligosaccharide flippase family protein [Muribaculaceae bacterium]